MAEKKMAGESTIFTRQPPAGFDPEKPYADGLALWKQKEYVARETFVGIETSKILRDRMKDCYIREGVNHLANCKEEVKAYLDSIKSVGFSRINWN